MPMISMMFKKKWPLFILVLPTFVFMSIYLYYPFLMNIFNSFNTINGLGTASEGLNTPFYLNYINMVKDPKIHIALKNSMIFMVCTIVFQVGFSVVLALMVDGIGRKAEFFRTVYFFPIVISATALGLMFNLIFLYKGGMVNSFLSYLGASGSVDWKDSKHWLFTAMLPVMWQYVGFYFVIIETGLNNISEELYEAARIDGANQLQLVRFIKLPLIYNTVCTCIVLAITGSLKIFDLPWTMFPNGLPEDMSWLLGTYMYKQTFIASDVDYGSAISLLIVVMGVIFAMIANKVFKEKDY